MKNIAMLLVVACAAMLSVSCTDDTTEDTGVAERLFRPVGITLTPNGTSMTASWAGINDAVGYWCELYKRTSAGTGSTGASQYNYELVASNELVTATEWTVSGLERTATYAFRVKSVHADLAKSSYFSDFYTARVPGMTEVLVATVVDPVAALVKFEWMEGYDIQWIKITAPDGGVRTVNVDDADGSVELSDFVSGTFTAVAGNAENTYNEVTFIIPVLYDIDSALITFDGVHFSWRPDPDIVKLVCTPASGAAVEFDVEGATGEYDADAAAFAPETTYTAQLHYASGAEPSNTARFTTMQAKPEGVVVVSTAEELVAAVMEGVAVIALNPGEYDIPSVPVCKEDKNPIYSTGLLVNHPFTLMAATKKMPKIYTQQFVTNNAEYVDGTLRFESLEIECSDFQNTTRCFLDGSNQGACFKRVEIENCYIHDFGSSFFRYNRTANLVEEVYVNNNLLLNIFGQNSYLQFCATGAENIVKEITYTNNTATGLDTQKAGVRFIHYNADENTKVVIENNTMLFRNSTGRAYFYINNNPADAGRISIQNNIFYNEDGESSPRNVSNFDSRSVNATINNNVVTFPWGTGGDGNNAVNPNEEGALLPSWGDKYLEADPGFKKPGSNDYTVTNDDVVKAGAGDPRWLQ